mmetsp:Transcript_34065/g.81916  ORF Transcript_34065/g.81916 Transcript_34065/m.81916 type:complete len:544 (-) Transcript_34065:1716-3347(-)
MTTKAARSTASSPSSSSFSSSFATSIVTMMVVAMSSLPLLLMVPQQVDATYAFPRNHSSYFNIQIPTHLSRNHSIEHRPAMFGSHFNLRMEEGSLILPVRVPPKHNMKLCTMLTDVDIKDMKLNRPPFIMLVERGDCTFVHKVREAQRVGAAGVLITDLKHTAADMPKIMANDGSGQDIGIPSMLIDKKHGQDIFDVLGHSNHSTVVVEMAYHKPKYDYMVSLDVWHNPIDYHTIEFFKDWSVLENVFVDENSKSMLNFHSHSLLLDGTSLGCLGEAHKNESACFDLCTNNGRYCHIPSQNNLIAGKDVVGEILRRECIHKHYGSKDGATFWSYLSHFYKYCMDPNNPSYFHNHECIADAFSHSGIDTKIIDECMADTGALDGDVTNSALEATLQHQNEAGVFKSPTVMVNHDRALLWDGFTAKNVLMALCDSYISGQKPHVCYACMHCGDPMACAQRTPMKCLATDGQDKENEHRGHDDHHDDHHDSGKKKKGGHFFKVFFGFMLIGGAAAGYVYYKKHMENNGGDGLGSYTLQDAFLSESG